MASPAATEERAPGNTAALVGNAESAKFAARSRCRQLDSIPKTLAYREDSALQDPGKCNRWCGDHVHRYQRGEEI